MFSTIIQVVAKSQIAKEDEFFMSVVFLPGPASVARRSVHGQCQATREQPVLIRRFSARAGHGLVA
jgi:hypothetical protein